MKSITKYSLLVLLLSSTHVLLAQPKSKYVLENTLKDQLCVEVSKVKLGSGETCDKKAQQLVTGIKGAMALSYKGDVLSDDFKKVGDLIQKMTDKAKKNNQKPPLDKGPFKTLEDRIFYSFGSAKKYADFIKSLTGGTTND
ncbi:MAG: hypothetical protein AAF598_12860, partial [Bacteroidota bacterium]